MVEYFLDAFLDASMNRFKLLLSLLAAALPLAASADIYKCRLANGQMEISNTPCATGATVKVRPEERVSEADRRQAERDLERMRGYIDQREAAQRAESAGEFERQRLQAGQRAAPPSLATGSYSNADECLRDVAQMALGAAMRAQLEGECRQIAPRPPAAISSPYPVVVPVYVGPPPPMPHPKPPKRQEPQPEAPKMSILPRR